MFESLLNAFRAPDIRRRILVVLGLLIAFRFLAAVPVPGVDRAQLDAFLAGNPLFGLLNLFSGGGLSNFSVVALGLNPYINASIIMQLMQGVVPSLQALSREGEYGRNKITQYTRYLSVPMALLQSYGFLALLNSQGVLTGIFDLGSFDTLTQIVTLTAGSVALMWVGELITERGIGNGISFIIFAGIVSQAPSALGAFFANPNPAAAIAFGIVAIVAVAVIIYIQEGQRRIPVQYAKRVIGRRMSGGGSTYLPLRVNMAGVIPVIFAASLMAFPPTVGELIQAPWARDLSAFFNPSGWGYIVGESVFIIVFTYFYTAVTFNPVEQADNLKKYGGFIPGVRPGRPTAEFLDRILSRLTFWGALYLAAVAALPTLLISQTTANFFFGGTAILIVVGVALDTMKQLEAQLMMRNYEGFLK